MLFPSHLLGVRFGNEFKVLFKMEMTRLELVTSCMPCKRSSQVSYTPKIVPYNYSKSFTVLSIIILSEKVSALFLGIFTAKKIAIASVPNIYPLSGRSLWKCYCFPAR